MFKNYLKIAYRNIKKHIGYSLINVAGLAIGMACCILILLFVFDELSYDKFHENHDRIYRVTRKWFNADSVVKDFHFESLHQEISPIVMFLSKTDLAQISIRIGPQNIPQTMAFLRDIWRSFDQTIHSPTTLSMRTSTSSTGPKKTCRGYSAFSPFCPCSSDVWAFSV